MEEEELTTLGACDGCGETDVLDDMNLCEDCLKAMQGREEPVTE